MRPGDAGLGVDLGSTIRNGAACAPAKLASVSTPGQRFGTGRPALRRSWPPCRPWVNDSGRTDSRCDPNPSARRPGVTVTTVWRLDRRRRVGNGDPGSPAGRFRGSAQGNTSGSLTRGRRRRAGAVMSTPSAEFVDPAGTSWRRRAVWRRRAPDPDVSTRRHVLAPTGHPGRPPTPRCRLRVASGRETP